ncbi:hypothetical protein AOB54_08020 [beta proteobacterium MWH-UniP1]
MRAKISSLVVVLGITGMSVGMSHAQSTRGQSNTNAHQTTQFCQEERRFAEPWIQWAAESRLACIQQTKSEPERQACFGTVLAQLDALQQEHAEVYRSQMKTLKSDHPVMLSIMQRLQSNREFAKMALETGNDPAQLAMHREQTCLARR